MKNWDNIDYQKIEKANLKKGFLWVQFHNGDATEIPIQSVLPVGVTNVDTDSVNVSDYLITLKSNGVEINIPWDKIRILTDKDFAKGMAEKAEENSRLVGLRLKSLRERKSIKSLELAERAQVTPQTITRIEKGHNDVSFATLRKLLAAMGYTLKDLAQEEISLSLESPALSWDFILKKLSKVGIDASLSNKIIPQQIRGRLTNPKEILPDLVQTEIATYFSRVFGWSNDSLWNNGPLTISDDPAQLAFFKTPSKGNINQIRAYSHYAYYLANAICKVNKKKPKIEYPGELKEFKDSFYENYDSLSFGNLLQFTWDMGINVIPLDDQGVFHGASWNINESHVIILKQRNESHARWTFDLLHELYHVFAHLDRPNSSIIETEELNPFGNNDSPEELEANSFANQFIFGHRSEEIAKTVLEKADYRLELLRNAVKETAEETDINPEFIANYLAFRLQMNGQNWWGTANSFQTISPPPFDIAASILKSEINIEHLNPIDRNLLSSAINN